MVCEGVVYLLSRFRTVSLCWMASCREWSCSVSSGNIARR